VKAFAPAGSGGTGGGDPPSSGTGGTTTSTPTTLLQVSGNNQTGSVGQALPSPFVVKVTDSGGNPVSGIGVIFAVTGGGSLSATNVTTNTSGLASATLTLGPSAGTNTVSATSGTLSGSPITFSATGTTGSANITWNVQPRTSPWPAFIGWGISLYDPNSLQTIWYLAPANYGGIYSTHMFFYNSATGLFTDVGGTNSITDACPGDTPTMPGDRHPDGQMALDTKRNVLWFYGGVNQTCNQGTPPNTNPHQDMYYLTLNANPALDVWTQIKPAHLPMANGVSSMIYDPDDDVLFVFGSDFSSQTHDNWVYCPTSGSGTMSQKQMAAGCANADDWTQVNVGGGVQPAGVQYPGLVYDVVTKKVIDFGGEDGGNNAQNQTWAYDVPTQTWTQKGLLTTAPPPYTGPVVAAPAMSYNPTTNKILYHQTSNTGAPADWQYDPGADTWTQLVSTGGGSPIDAIGVYDPSTNSFLTWNKNVSTGYAEIWKGSLTGSTLPPPTLTQTTLLTVSGNNQTGSVGQALPNPFVVKVTDGSGNPVAGVTVIFQVTAGGGTLSATSVSTNSSGTASSTLTLGVSGGLNTVTASSATLAGSPIAFSATGNTTTSTPKTLLQVSGNNQTGSVGQALPSPFVVKVTDSGGNPVSGIGVIFAVTGGGGSLSATNVTTNTSGLASATLTLGPSAGTNTVSATSGTLSGSPITFSATGTAGSTKSSPCDLNYDGLVNVLDVQIAIQQALGITACGNADLQGTGSCTVVDVQRIVNASLGAACKTGP